MTHTDESHTAMPRRETAIGVTAAGVLVIAIAVATVRSSDVEPGIDDPIGSPTSSVTDSPTGALPTTEPTGPVSETGTEQPTTTEEPSGTAAPTPSPTTSVDPDQTAAPTEPTEQPSDGDDDDGLDDMPDTGGGTLALFGAAVAGAAVAAGRRRD